MKRPMVHGFTMVELLASIAIIAVLVAMILPFAVSYVSRAQAAADRQTLAVLNDAINRYKTEGGDLKALTVGKPFANLLTKLKTPVSWVGVTHQFLRDSDNISQVKTVEATGSGRTYKLTRMNTYTSQTGGTDVTSGGGPTPNFRYFRWTVSDLRGDLTDGVQAEELQLLLDGTPVAWPVGTVIHSTNSPNPVGANDGPQGLADNDTGIRWFTGSGLSAPCWVIIDCGVAVNANQYRFMTGSDMAPRDPVYWQLEGSNDLSAWNSIDSQYAQYTQVPTARQAWTPSYAFWPTPVVVSPLARRYFRWTINGSRGGNGDGVQLEDFQLLLDGVPVTWSGAAIIQSSNSPNPIGAGEGPQRIIDNNNGTKWYAGGATYPCWVIIDAGLGVPVTANQYRFMTGSDGEWRDPISWTLESSNDLSTWDPVDTKTSQQAVVPMSRQTWTPTYSY